MTTVRFDDALVAARDWVTRHRATLGEKVVVLRDVLGRPRVICHRGQVPESSLVELDAALGAFSPGVDNLVLDRELFLDDLLSDECRQLADGVWLIDRLVSEQGWRRPPVATEGHKPRITFFGIKGGVGRSSALVALARSHAEAGSRVLVVDLDIESPGATSMLLLPDELPEFGVLDWFVEDAVGQGNDELLSRMVGSSRIAEILVAPALGARSVPSDQASIRDGSFVAKLGRAYASPDGTDFAARIEALLIGLERTHSPDIVLIDSRAGIHDIAAAAVPRLGGEVLLFAGATSQTWLGYRLLFSAWARDRAVLSAFRERLSVVAAQVPETGREAYYEKVRLQAYDTFASFIYDEDSSVAEESADESAFETFSFNLNDPDAPHAPIPIYWSRALLEWEPAKLPEETVEALTSEQFQAAFGPFIRTIMSLGVARTPDTES